jgi:oligopeptide transport system substrate-binding protein
MQKLCFGKGCNKIKKIVLLTLGLFLFSVGGMCMQKKSSKKNRVLRFALPVDVPSLDVNSRGHDVYAAPIMNLLFEGLMRKDKNGVPQLAIAHKVDLSRDQKKYTFYLRDSQWSDGTEITAYDFEYSWKRAINPNSKYVSRVPYYFYSIKNARPCFLGEGSIEDVAIKAIDNKTIKVELEYPDPYFLDLVSCSFYFPIPKHIVEKDPEWASKANLICNGPFLLNFWKRNNCLQLEKNLHYWNQEHISLSGVEVSIISSDLTTLQMFEKGELDWWGDPLARISYDSYRSLQESQLIQKKEGPLIYWLFLNTEKYPLNNKKLRQALSYAIDRDSLINNIFHGFSSPARGILSPPLRVTNMPYFEDNIKSAKRLFQEALDEMGIDKDKFPELEFSCVADSELHRRISQAIQDQWRKNLGIKISIKGSEWFSYYSDVGKGNYDIGLMGWEIPCPNPNYIFEVFERKEDIINMAFWEDKEFKNTVKQMRNALGEIERVNLTIKAEKILMEEMPVIPLAFLEQVFAKNPKLKGEILTPFPPIDFTSAYFE